MRRFVTLTLVALTAGGALTAAEVRLATADALKAAISQPKPEYSEMARKMKITGAVEVEVKISERGGVEDVKVMSGNALLTPSVIRTVKDWKFKPVEQEGKAVSAVTQLRFDFKP